MEQKEMAYHQRVRAGYLAMAAQEPDRWMVIDAARGIKTVQARIRDRIRRELATGRPILAPPEQEEIREDKRSA
jgi:dTMP kinase